MLKINQSNYQGYLWFSDRANPQIIEGEFSVEMNDSDNPFIIEGQLYDKSAGLSISIKHADGCYYVKEYRITEEDFNNPDIDLVEYLPHRMPKISKLLFLQKWNSEVDEFCCGMETLVPSERIFVGYK